MIEPRTPYEQDDGVTQLQEDVLGLLEDAGIPAHVNDQIMALIAIAELKDEQISCVAIKYPDHLGVFALPRPARHHHVMWTRLFVDGQSTRGGAIQGFLTTEGRFVDRKEGLAIATAKGQIIEKNGNEFELYSEDMWETPPEAVGWAISHLDDDKE